MHSLINSGDGGPCCVVIGDLDDSSFDELVSNVPRWIGEVTNSGELDSKVLTNVNTDITSSVVGSVNSGVLRIESSLPTSSVTPLGFVIERNGFVFCQMESTLSDRSNKLRNLEDSLTGSF